MYGLELFVFVIMRTMMFEILTLHTGFMNYMSLKSFMILVIKLHMLKSKEESNSENRHFYLFSEHIICLFFVQSLNTRLTSY